MNKYTYQRLSDDRYSKLMFNVRTQVSAILNKHRVYGMDTYVDVSEKQFMQLIENFGMAVRGKEIPIHILDKPTERRV